MKKHRPSYRFGDLTRSLVSRLVLKEMKKVIENDAGIRVYGPVDGDDAVSIERIRAFRAAHYAETARYLTNAEQQELEEALRLDPRSHHFYAMDAAGAIIGALRVTPAPFELAQLDAALGVTAADFARHLELNRLVVAPAYQGSGVGKRLCYAAMLWAFKGEYQGFIAICREARKTEFERFGLRAFEDRTYTVPARDNGEYRFMWGNWLDLAARTGRHYARKRLSKKVDANRIESQRRKSRRRQSAAPVLS